jgi:mRNA interferase MazF|tara:strand:- start:327 stop:677 length:351 start_codon:yes stop_codon:yes gene_type:complete
MKIKKWDIWLADLSPQRGTEPGKTRPVVVVQTDLLNSIHPSTIICPLTTAIQKNVDILRVHIKKSRGGLKKDSDILVDQIRAIDNLRLIKKLGVLSAKQRELLTANLRTVLDIVVF